MRHTINTCMKLLVNGCSFTHGHKDYTGKHARDPAEWVWASRLGQHFESSVNLAWRGTGNGRIVRETINYLSSVPDPDNWLIIIQWSNPERFEWYNKEFKAWVSALPNRAVFESRHLGKYAIGHLTNIHRKYCVPYMGEIREDDVKLMEEMQHMLVLQQYLKKRGFNNVLYTGMDKWCLIPTHIDGYYNNGEKTFMSAGSPNNKTILEMSKLFDFTKYVSAISSISRGHRESEEDAHPNDIGHELFYEYILEQIKINYKTSVYDFLV